MGLRVLFVNHVSAVSGAERTLRDLLTHLPADIEPVVACPGLWEEPLPAMMVDIGVERVDGPAWRPHRLPSWQAAADFLTGAHAVHMLSQTIQATRPAVVHANSFPCAVLMSLSRLRMPWVWHARDVEIARRFVAPVAGRAPAIAAISDTVAAFVTRCAPRAAHHLRVIFNGLDIDRVRAAAQSEESLREHLGLPEDTPLVGVAAQLVPWKRLDVFLRAIPGLLDTGAHFLIIGADLFGEHGRLANDLEELATSLGVADRLHWLGYRASPEPLLASLDVYLHSAVDEPLGRVLLEAMALGTPCVAADRAGPAEMIRHGETGLLYKAGDPLAAGDAVRALLSDAALRQRLAAAAEADLRARFTAERMASEFADLYRSLAH
jgi:glycosyltransferase involved in cell wall biosynthesis